MQEDASRMIRGQQKHLHFFMFWSMMSLIVSCIMRPAWWVKPPASGKPLGKKYAIVKWTNERYIAVIVKEIYLDDICHHNRTNVKRCKSKWLDKIIVWCSKINRKNYLGKVIILGCEIFECWLTTSITSRGSSRNFSSVGNFFVSTFPHEAVRLGNVDDKNPQFSFRIETKMKRSSGLIAASCFSQWWRIWDRKSVV